MLAGFPKTIKTTQMGRGWYLIEREDGFSIEVRKNGRGVWYQTSNGSQRMTLSAFKYDMKNGFMPQDQVKADGVA